MPSSFIRSQKYCHKSLVFLYAQPQPIPERVTFRPKHPKWDHSLQFTLIEHRTGLVCREGSVNYIPVPALEHLLSSQWIPVLALTCLLPLWSECPFTLDLSVAQNLSDAFKIGGTLLCSVTEIAPKSPFICVNRGSIPYGFCKAQELSGIEQT